MKDGGAASQLETHFNSTEVESIYAMAEKLTGTCQSGKYRKNILVNNVRRRMDANSIFNLDDYFRLVEKSHEEKNHFISALTIHTTSWFREPLQYEILERRIVDNIRLYRNQSLRVLCGACSTGEEVYSFALVLEKLRYFYHGFDYQIVGSDVDPVSVGTATRAIYNMENGFKDIPEPYRKFLMTGTGKTAGQFTLTKAIRDRCSFKVKNLLDFAESDPKKFDVTICRNVLIYFKPEEATNIVKNLVFQTADNGMLILGTSEAFLAKDLSLVNLGQTCYVQKGQEKLTNKDKLRRVLIVEDAAIDRAIMKRQFEKFGFEVLCAETTAEADKILNEIKIDIITLDLHLPEQSGHDWLLRQREKGMKTPVVIISAASPHEAQKVLDLLGNGAQDYFNKNELRKNAPELVERLEAIIHESIKTGGRHQPKVLSTKKVSEKKRPNLILIGASTGGTEALVDVLPNMPKDSPPILVVQHIAAQFAKAFYERLGKVSGLKIVDEPKDRMFLEDGHLYMSVGDYHIGVGEYGGRYCLRTGTAMTYGVHRPSVDYLFKSGCRVKGNITAILLTGMGKDGARGMAELHKRGALTYAESEESCVVFGMPKEAIQLGAARIVGNLKEIREGLLKSLS